MRTTQRCGLCIIGALALMSIGCARPDTGKNDAAVEGTVKRQLAATRDLGGALSEIQVSAHDGVVMLTGRVPTEAAKREAAAVADDVDGVDHVQNQLVVAMAGNAPATTRVGDVPPENLPAPPPAPNAPPLAPEIAPPVPAQPVPAPAGQ